MAKDEFGYGTEQNKHNDEDYIKGLLENAKIILSKDGELPKELKEEINKINPADWSGGFLFGKGNESFAEEIDEVQRVINDYYKWSPGGRYRGGGLKLDEGESPTQHLLNYYPMRGENNGR